MVLLLRVLNWEVLATSRANEVSLLKFSLSGNEQLGFISSANTFAYRPAARQESGVN